jgi:hypothetical protein
MRRAGPGEEAGMATTLLVWTGLAAMRIARRR